MADEPTTAPDLCSAASNCLQVAHHPDGSVTLWSDRRPDQRITLDPDEVPGWLRPVDGDLRGLAAGALADYATEPYGDVRLNPERAAAKVLSAVLPAAVRAIEALADRQHQDLVLDTPADTAAYWAYRAAITDAAGIVRRLAATGPADGPSEPSYMQPPADAQIGEQLMKMGILKRLEHAAAAPPDLRAAHPGLTPAAVDDLAALLADLDRVTRERDTAAENLEVMYRVRDEMAAERDRLAATIEAFTETHGNAAYLADNLAAVRAERDEFEAERDRLAETIRRVRAVVDKTPRAGQPGRENVPDAALVIVEMIWAALGDSDAGQLPDLGESGSNLGDAEPAGLSWPEAAPICPSCQRDEHIGCTWDEATPPARCTCPCPGWPPPPVPGIDETGDVE